MLAIIYFIQLLICFFFQNPDRKLRKKRTAARKGGKTCHHHKAPTVRNAEKREPQLMECAFTVCAAIFSIWLRLQTKHLNQCFSKLTDKTITSLIQKKKVLKHTAAFNCSGSVRSSLIFNQGLKMDYN